MVKKVITNLDSSKASCPDCISGLHKFCAVTILNVTFHVDIVSEYNWELLIASAHVPLCFKKIRTTTTTTFLISITVVLNPYSTESLVQHLILNPLDSYFNFNFNGFVSVLYLNTLWSSNNGIQCINSSSTEIFWNMLMVHGQYIGFVPLLLISIDQKWQHCLCYANRLCSVQAAKIDGNHHENWNSIIYRKGAIYRTETEQLFLPAKGWF